MNVVELKVVARDMSACVRCGRMVTHLARGRDWSMHHRRPRGAGGTSLAWVNAPANLVVLSGSGTTGCHGWVEVHRAEARGMGWLISQNGKQLAEEVAIRHFLLGLVYLTDEGGYRPVELLPESWGEGL